MKIINIKTYRAFKQRKALEAGYQHSLIKMDKAELLQELLSYNEAYQRDPNDIGITIRGQHLMEVLEERAELAELQELSRDFQTKLKTRLYQQIQAMGE